ncbi:hypothetical protein BV25DRAFT_1357740 [Artomyces pyxidatus]|uniref:Uncharacterized protein n=1 Tax=Artomyces pyxidatus TaxID=48021 RepID=A0ACB8SN47_9AGAM|nr:hypothetical protein BV25DRAFT_1357740 [Artomyces pyxidatus]
MAADILPCYCSSFPICGFVPQQWSLPMRPPPMNRPSFHIISSRSIVRGSDRDDDIPVWKGKAGWDDGVGWDKGYQLLGGLCCVGKTRALFDSYLNVDNATNSFASTLDRPMQQKYARMVMHGESTGSFEHIDYSRALVGDVKSRVRRQTTGLLKPFNCLLNPCG